MSAGDAESAGVVAPPPLVYLVPLVLGLLIQRFYPVAILPSGVARVLGIALLAGWVIVSLPAILAFRRAGTSVNPARPTNALVTWGPYRVTRNPLYVGLTMLYLGLTAWFNALWPLLLLPIVLVVMQRGVIVREERYLERKFGEEYRRYKARVRRWL
jgi:protein-S-isoprenylcysteine O-methyltransferase Ste14